MTFRYARHTTDLREIEKFYTQIVGLEKLGEFHDHDHYNGLLLGHPNLNWHLEFTSSNEKPTSTFDKDDILVFYVNTEIEISDIRQRIYNHAIEMEIPKNPYWTKNGIMIFDPDGCRIVFSLRHVELTSDDELTSLVKEKCINNWSDLISFTKKLPFGRNQNREDLSLVMTEAKGTCSSKHAFLKKVADLNQIENVKLILGMYKMNHVNTPKINSTLLDNGLAFIPEAHCYVKLNSRRFDITAENANIENLIPDIVEEMEIEPEQVCTFKVEFHKNYLKKWINENSIAYNFDKVWEIREECIQKLEDFNTNI